MATSSKKKAERKVREETESVDITATGRIDLPVTRDYINLPEIWIKAGKPNVFFAFTGRGPGKTTSSAVWLADYCYKNHRKFILLSRDAIKQVKRQAWFVNSMVRGFTPYKIDCIGNEFIIDGQVIGFNYNLHAHADYRSIEFPDVDIIVMEEFVELDPSEYWSDNGLSEAQFLSDIASTVFRDREDGAIWLLGNNINEDSKFNPYFDAFGIDFDESEFKINNLYTIRDDNIKVVFWYGGMFRKDDKIPGWAPYMPLNEVALSGEFAPNPLILSNFLKNHNLDLTNFELTGDGVALCTDGKIEYITFYDYEDNEYQVVSRTARSRVFYEPYRFRTKAQIDRFRINHETKLLYESAKDSATIRKALNTPPSIVESQKNLDNFNRLMREETGAIQTDVRFQTFGEFDRWAFQHFFKVQSVDQFIADVSLLPGDIAPRWIDIVVNRYRSICS